ncbi:uncharacterized protein C8A04DRAFT_14034 [Dichotomopilus funicola]|uniref:Nephrocystin 3-like N-terminal domain-containing protein n=1 Tax=Dichotomopilus funicola TaxID=1934379 RepID=A0AAN6UYN7_9PEZI|nr:hypothetical protein C8A04DRAFT_14034 [Dichotomopilus funicola]
MDPISLTASIIAVTQGADRIAQLCRYYIGAVDDYPRDLRTILIETSTLKALFENLGFLIESDGDSSPMLKSLDGGEGPIAGCQRTISELEFLFPTSSANTTQKTKRKRVKTTLAQLAWPFRQEKARTLLGQLVQHKTTINTAISSDALRDIKEIRRDLRAVCRMLSASETSDVCTWLEHTNPSNIHNKAVADYEQGTGDWITRTPEWSNWMKSTDRCLWVHGIPGAGKTVLASFAIRQVIRDLKESGDANSTCAYYYCHHAHNQDEAVPALRWIVSQLCRVARRVPQPLYEAYHLRRLPNIEELLQHLESILGHFARVSIVIDALDESQSRETLLRLIRDILGDPRFVKIRLLATSRQYSDIEREMLSIATPLSMSNSFVEEDIRRVIAAGLKSNPIFQQWPAAFRTEVEAALSSGAKGMFRWAVCQLDILRRLKHQNRVREAIKNLPETLDETYERIFSCIAPEDVDLVRHCLWWTMFHNAVWDLEVLLPTQVLIDTYYLMTGKELADDEPLVPNLEILKDSCGCLLSFQATDENGDFKVSLAHYTVREYLESSRSSTGQSRLFTRSGKAPHIEAATALFNQLLEVEAEVDVGAMETCLENYDHSGVITANTSTYRLFTGLRIAWRGEIEVRPSLIFDLLDPHKPHFRHLISVVGKLWIGGIIPRSHLLPDFSSMVLTPSDNPPEAALMAHLLWLNRLDLARELLRGPESARIWEAQLLGRVEITVWDETDTYIGGFRYFSGNIVELFATVGRNTASFLRDEALEALRLLLDHGLDRFDPTSILVHFIGTHGHWEDEACSRDCPLQRLLSMGADPNAPGYPCTPLQIAVLGRDLDGIQALLQAGADLNATGSTEVKDWEEDGVLGLFCGLRGVKPIDILRARKFLSMENFDRKVEDDEVFSLLSIRG